MTAGRRPRNPVHVRCLEMGFSSTSLSLFLDIPPFFPPPSPAHYQVAMRSASTFGPAPVATARPRKNRWGAGAGGAAAPAPAPAAAAAAAAAVDEAGRGGIGFGGAGNGVDAASSAAAAGLVAAAAAASSAGKSIVAAGGGEEGVGLGKRSRGFSEGGAWVFVVWWLLTVPWVGKMPPRVDLLSG